MDAWDEAMEKNHGSVFMTDDEMDEYIFEQFYINWISTAWE